MIQEHKKMDGEALVREYCMTGSELIKDQAVLAFLPLVKHIVGRINVSSAYIILQKDDCINMELLVYYMHLVDLIRKMEPHSRPMLTEGYTVRLLMRFAVMVYYPGIKCKNYH